MQTRLNQSCIRQTWLKQLDSSKLDIILTCEIIPIIVIVNDGVFGPQNAFELRILQGNLLRNLLLLRIWNSDKKKKHKHKNHFFHRHFFVSAKRDHFGIFYQLGVVWIIFRFKPFFSDGTIKILRREFAEIFLPITFCYFIS